MLIISELQKKRGGRRVNKRHDVPNHEKFIKNEETFNSSNQSSFAPTSNSTAITDGHNGTLSESFSNKFEAEIFQISQLRDCQKTEEYLCKIIAIAKTNPTVKLTRKIVKIEMINGVLVCKICKSNLKKPSEIASKLDRSCGIKQILVIKQVIKQVIEQILVF